MNKIFKLGTLSLITAALLVGCGGSDDSTEDTELTGYFIDAEVSGVDYETTSGKKGTTDKFGRFNYKSGDKVKLKIGNLTLGEVSPTAKGLITPETLSAGDSELKTLLLRMLQSLDSDNNTSNGITIPTNLLTNITETEISEHNERTLLELDDRLKESLDKDHDNNMDVDKDEADKHFDDSRRTWNDGKRPDDHESNEDNHANDEGGNNGSNIGYLKKNHANYHQHGSTTLMPTPTKNASEKSIDWTISATTEEGATKLADHINFMLTKLKEGENPRGWDKLFLMEAYMKFNHYYTTTVEKTASDVVISKEANTTCAYDVISAHSDAVSGDFFGKGDIKVDYSTIAESILASTSCQTERTAIEAYIVTNQEDKHEEEENEDSKNRHGQKDN